jgi:hypothetical protein
MSEQHTWKRIRERLELKLPVRVVCKETPDFEWMEITRLQNVTPFGAGFSLKRPTEKGRILHMTIPMPRQLRVFDHAEDQYRIYALVRYVRGTTSPETKLTTFDVGVALATPEEIKPIPTSDQRIHTRHNIAVDMQIETIDEKGEPGPSEITVTENISKRGATVYTTLQIPIGRFIRLTSAQYGMTVVGAIRARSTGADGIPRIHVEFIDKEWPL